MEVIGPQATRFTYISQSNPGGEHVSYPFIVGIYYCAYSHLVKVSATGTSLKFIYFI